MGQLLEKEKQREIHDNILQCLALDSNEAQKLTDALITRDAGGTKPFDKCFNLLVPIERFHNLFPHQVRQFTSALVQVIHKYEMECGDSHNKNRVKRSTSQNILRKLSSLSSQRQQDESMILISDALKIASELLVDPGHRVEMHLVEAAFTFVQTKDDAGDNISLECFALRHILTFIHMQISYLFRLNREITLDAEQGISLEKGDLHDSIALFDFDPYTSAFTDAYASSDAAPDKTDNLSLLRQFMISWLQRNIPYLRSKLILAFRAQLVKETPPNQQIVRDVSQDDFDEIPFVYPKTSASIKQIEAISRGLRGHFTLSKPILLNDELISIILFNTPRISMTPWIRLFASWTAGLSFTRLAAAIVDYPAPTVLLLQSQDQQIFGAYITEPWRENGSKCYGNAEGYLFKADPNFAILRCTGVGQNFMYLNSRNKSSPKGLGFGGQLGFFRLWVSDDFTDSYVISVDSTYENGLLYTPGTNSDDGVHAYHDNELVKHKFEVCEVEVWGCGDEFACRAQRVAQQRSEMVKLERKKVDKSRFVKNEFDREYLLGGNFAKSYGINAADT